MPRNAEYDPNVAQDHTGMSFRHVPGQAKRAPWELFRNPAPVVCECGSETWRIVADNDPKSGLMLIQCPKCQRYSRPWEARIPQMDDHRAKALGLWVPRMYIEQDIDVER